MRKSLESERRPATADEQDTRPLRRIRSRRPSDLHPDPVTTQYKPGWQPLGDELKSLLTPEEYDSAKRTTLSQLITSPAVMTARHDALARPDVPRDGLVREPECGAGRFMAHASTGQCFVGMELDSLSGRTARALHPMADIRVEHFQ